MIDVIIPCYKPTEYMLSLLRMLKKQTIRPQKVIVINTEKDYWDRFFGQSDLLSRYPFLEVHHISKEEFDHGKTRNLGVSYSNSDFFLMMTDDAVPDNEYMIENMLKAFDNPKAGMCYARQLSHPGTHAIEKYTRVYNYPTQSRVKGKADIETLGIKAFFASDVCCMYRRSIFDQLGGFINHTIFNEDMIFARKMIETGYFIVYESKACVKHSHNYTGVQYLRRNFDLGVSQADHPETFADVKSEGEGIRLVKETAAWLCRKFMPWMVVKLIWQSGCKYIGYFLGKRYAALPKGLVMKLTMTPSYFEAPEPIH